MLRQFQDCLYLLDSRSRVQFSLLALMMLVGAGLESLSIGLILPFLQLIEDPALITTVPVLGDLMESLGTTDKGQLMVYAGFGLLAVVIVKNLFMVALIYYQYRIANQNDWLLARRLYRHYLESPFVHAMRRNSAELIRNVHEAVRVTTNSVILGFVSLFTEIFVLMAITALLLALQPVAALSAAAVLCIAITGYQVLVRQRFVAWGRSTLSLQKNLIQSLQQGLHSLKTTKVHGREEFFLSGFSKVKRTLVGIGAILNTANNTPRLWVEMVFAFGVVLVIVILISGDAAETGILPVLGLFAAAAFRLMPSINRMIVAFNNIKRGKAALDSVVRDIRSGSPEMPKAEVSSPDSNDKIDLGPLRSIRFDGVSFTYPNEPLPAIDNISLDISPGQSLGLAGPSGAGKTTLVDILLGLLAPTKGRVLINGQDLSRINKAWRHRLGYVPQSIYILDDTLRRNIAFGYADDEIDEDAVLTAIEQAQLEDFVDGLTEGLDTILGEHGARLSGGQQQRIGIARALYHNPEVLVLDEATSSLDTETEQEITAAIDNLRGIKTLVIIAHRLSTVRQCDRLIYLENGKLADSGTFEELASGNDAFRNLVELSRL